MKYDVFQTKKFRKDYKRLMRSGYDYQKLDVVIAFLINGKTLPTHYKNHRLKGNKAHLEECHIENDWLLLYQRSEKELILVLVRTGKHLKVLEE